MADIIVKIFRGEVEVASKLIPSPVTALEAYSVLQNANAGWVGTLIQPTSNDLLVGQRELTPGRVYHLHLQAGVQQSAPTPICGRERTAQFLAMVLPDPSSYARDGQGCCSSGKLKQLLHLLRARRPAQEEVERFQQLPVALLDRTLGQIEEDCAFATPTAQDTDFAERLIFALSGSFVNEAARMETFWDMASSEFGMHFERIVADREHTDESAAIVTSQVLALGTNLEVELDTRTGGASPRLQSFCPATLYSCDDRRKLRALCRCPTLLVELSGPNLSLSGFAYGQDPCCDQLSQTKSLLWQPKSEIMIGAPRVVCALRRAWPALQALYQGLSNKPMPTEDDWQLDFPYPCSYTSLNGLQCHGFTYIRRLTDFTFVALADEPAAGSGGHLESSEPGSRHQYLFIKFCKNYSVEGHKALQDAGFAPRLHGCEQLPGRWLMVAMECLLGASMWNRIDGMDKPREALRAAVAALHEAGFVHGDLRECNILVKKQQVYVVDLEWAGKMGEAKYPIFMNQTNIDWPPGAGDNEPITKEHDFYWMNKMLSE